jgi:hypothetical protein
MEQLKYEKMCKLFWKGKLTEEETFEILLERDRRIEECALLSKRCRELIAKRRMCND